jgi:hypothetical protein
MILPVDVSANSSLSAVKCRHFREQFIQPVYSVPLDVMIESYDVEVIRPPFCL